MSSPERVKILPARSEDLPICFRIVSESFGHDAPFVDAYFPNHETHAGRAEGARRLKAWQDSEPESTFLKAVVEGTSTDGGNNDEEKIIGLAVWTHMTEVPPATLEDGEGGSLEIVWPEKSDREFMARLWRDYVKPRTKVVRQSGGKGVNVLELLAVHPDYQRLGAGTQLVSWGTRQADELGLQSVVEGTPAGRRLYEKCGLQVQIEEMDFDTGEEFIGRAKPTLIFMTRPPAS